MHRLSLALAILALALPLAGEPAAEPLPVDRQAQRVHRAAILIDGHNDITTPMVDQDYDLGTPSAGRYHTDLQRLREGGMTGQFFAIYVAPRYAQEGGSATRALAMIDAVHRTVERHPRELTLATSAAEIRRAKQQGKIAALMGIEGGHAIENSLGALRSFYRLGVRYMTLTHNNTNDWADAGADAPRHHGLTGFGRQVVREMNRLGMLVDISHVSDETASAALDASRAPVIASHSSARALADVPRNLPDDLLRRVAKSGGVVMVNFSVSFLDPKAARARRENARRFAAEIEAIRARTRDDPERGEAEIQRLLATGTEPVTVAKVADHVEHIARVAGIDHVGLGSDFDGGIRPPVGLADVSQYPNLTAELLRRGMSERDVRKVLGENFLRAFAAAERAAGATREPPDRNL